MRKLTFWTLLGITLIYASCKNDAKVESKTTPAAPVVVDDEISKWPKLEGGYNFKQHITNNTVKPKKGDYVYYDWSLSNNGQVYFSTFNTQRSPVKAKLTEVTGDSISPSMAALKTMSVGDSISIVVRGEKYLEQLKKNLNPNISSGDIVYQIVLRDIKNETEYQKDFKKDLEKVSERTKGMIPETKKKEIPQKTKSSKIIKK
jgi:hypothetical protein